MNMSLMHFRLVVLPALLLLSGCIIIGPGPGESYRGEWRGRILPRTYYDQNGTPYSIAALVVESGTKLPFTGLTHTIEKGFPLPLIDRDKRAAPASGFALDARVSVKGTMTGSVVRGPDGQRFLGETARIAATEEQPESFVLEVRQIRTIDTNTKEKSP